ncbi:putative ABC associated RTX toxin transporter [Candidatus Regiella insecticola LSR1]|uniref:Membrane fusion protein (MFP) family protein n=1 Tax=Candidatus Regiella insecticola LSR1 TaxID=663321 RepID=E0WTR5_9ENTR|nr:HlyD family type I secretion periplasmic adaptor subunit [Candidatus Regiella insecticola]EFL91602.1 putative ABC associated RTX toxin transporter [Candidatus Regiella insecticola LSR1]
MKFFYKSRFYQRIVQWRVKQQQVARSRDEYDFFACSWARRTAWCISLFLLLVLGWSIIGKLDIHATALGRVIVSDHSKLVQPLVEQGVVVAINVRDGEHVRAGQSLIELNPVGIDAEVRNINQQLMHRRLEKARLTALLTDDPLANFTPPAESEPHLIETRRALLQRELDERNAELKRQDVELAVNQTNYQAVEQKISSQKRLLENIEKRLEARRSLAKTQSIAKMELLEQEKEWLNAKAELSSLNGQQSILLSQQQSYIQGKQRFLAEKRRDYRERLNKASEVISQLTQEQIKIVERQNLQKLRAPVDGVVQQLAVHTLGGVVTPAQQLMVIVPENKELDY